MSGIKYNAPALTNELIGEAGGDTTNDSFLNSSTDLELIETDLTKLRLGSAYINQDAVRTSLKVGDRPDSYVTGLTANTVFGNNIRPSGVAGGNSNSLFGNTIIAVKNLFSSAIFGSVAGNLTDTVNGTLTKLALFGNSVTSNSLDGSGRTIMGVTGNGLPSGDNMLAIGTGGNDKNIIVSDGVDTTLDTTLQVVEEFKITTENSGDGMQYKALETIVDLSVSSTVALAIPDGAEITGVQIKNSTAITATTAISYDFSFTGGETSTIFTSRALTTGNPESEIVSLGVSGAVANGAFTPDAGTLDAGTIILIVHYKELALIP